MKTIVFVDRIKQYGAERVAWSLAEGLTEQHQVTLVTFSRQAPDLLSDDRFEYQKVGRDSGSYLMQAFTILRDLRSLARREKTDVVISFMPTGNILAGIAMLGLRTKTVITEHNVPSSLGLMDPKKSLLRILFAFFYRWSDSIVAVSEAVRDDLAVVAWMDRRKIRRIYNPLDYEFIHHESVKPLSLQADENPDEVKMLMVGRFKPAKGHEFAIRALANLPDHYSLFLIGDGDLEKQLEELAQDLGVRNRLHFKGFRRNPYNWMRWADVLLVPSRWEGFGLVLAEAAGIGIPAIASDAPALAEVAAFTGATVVPRGDAEALSVACEKVSRDQELVPNRVLEFQLQNVVAQYSTEIRRVVSGR